MSFGIPVRNGLAIGLGTVAALGVNVSVNPPDPGPPWIVLDADGNPYICSDSVLDSDGNSFTVIASVLDADGNTFNPI
jgi:hypothetical protein